MASTTQVVPATASPTAVRSGVSITGVLTGALVAYASAILFTLAARAVATYAGYKPYRLAIGGLHRSGLTAAVAIGLGVAVSLFWGGYTAGRMGRGRGWLNGLLVPVAVAAIAGIGLGVATILRPGPGLDLHLRLPAGYPHIHYLVPRWTLAAAAGAIGILASCLGGVMGVRWHTRLERRFLKEEAERLEARATFADLREAMAQPGPSLVTSPADVIAPPSGSGPFVGPPTGPLASPLERGVPAGP